MRRRRVVGVTSNPTIFQKALSRGKRLRRAAARGSRRDRRPEGDLRSARGQGRRRCLRPPATRVGEDRRARRLRLDGGRPAPGLRHRGHGRRGRPAPRARRPPQPAREDPGHEAGPSRDRGDDREGQVDQRHADLLARALRGGDRGVHPRARASRRPRRRPEPGRTRSRASSSHGSTPRPTGGSTRSAVTTSSRAGSRSRTRGSPTSSTSRRSRASAGSSSSRRAPARSGASGPRRRRRTPRTRDVLYVERADRPGRP